MSASGAVGADDAHPLEVARAAHLDLQGLVRRRAGRPVGGAVERVDRDRVARRRRRAVEPEDAPQRLGADLAEQVVERAVDRALGRHLARELRQAVEDRPGRERIVAEQRPHVLEDPGMGGVGPLVVVLVRSALAVADQTVVRDRDLDDPGVRVGRAGDDERLEVLERDDPGVELHRRQRIRPVRPRPVESSPRACSSGDRACASGAQGRRFDSYQAHPGPTRHPRNQA